MAKRAAAKDGDQGNGGGSWSPPTGKAKENATGLVDELIAEGKDPPKFAGTTSWDPLALATWYGSCCALSALLKQGNPWQSTLCGWTPDKGDNRGFHTGVLGTLIAIQKYLNMI